jgi:hypothetical protein
MQMPVNCRFGNPETVGFHDVVEVLAALDTVRNHAIHLIESIFVQGYAFTGFAEKRFISVLRRLGVIQLLSKGASRMPFLARVAYERRLQEAGADGVFRCSTAVDPANGTGFHCEVFGYGSLVLSDFLCDCLEGHAMIQAILNFKPVVKGHVLVLPAD